VRLAVADTGPLHYLVLIGEIGLLPALVNALLIPPEVRDELDHARTPAPVRAWTAAPPAWLRVQSAPPTGADPGLARLDPGERAAIGLALAAGADAVLVDDRAGVAAARARGLAAIGTLGLLQRGARRGLVDLPDAIARLVATNFHIRQELLDMLLAEDRARRGEPTDGA
jgi:predicted nucleic acid-binding protein